MTVPTPAPQLPPAPVPPPATVIDTDARLVKLAHHLLTEPLIGVDTESNSMYAYRERVCLIQISTRSADYIIDPLTIGDMQPLAPVFAARGIEKVFHAAEYDIMCLKRDYGFTFANLFDTMIAARICGMKTIGLGAVIGEVLGLALDKSHQRDDWGKRPLPADGLLYAQFDTHYLPALRDHFRARLEAEGRWPEASETFADLLTIRPGDHSFDPDGYWKLAIPNNLTRRQAAILREAYLLRERLAEQRDLPPFKIVPDKVLTALALAAPTTPAALERLDSFTPGLIRRYGEAFVGAVKRGLNAPLPTQPPLDPPSDPLTIERYTALREWRKERGIQRGVESDVILAREALWQLAVRAPSTLDQMRDIPGLGEWRLEQYGNEILRVLKKYHK